MFTVEVEVQNPPVETIEVSAIMLGGLSPPAKYDKARWKPVTSKGT